LTTPIILAVVIAAWSVLGAPKAYQSTASLWVDSPASTNSSVDNPSPTLTPPAQQAQSVLIELLATRAFALTVGHDSMLEPYLAAHPSEGFGPTALLGRLGGTGSVTERVISALGGSRVLTTVAGPQVLEISYPGPTPAVAQSTLEAIVTALQRDSVRYTAQHNQAAAAYYKTQVAAATKAVVAARDQASQYLSTHPSATAADPNLSALTAAEQAASAQLTQATANLNAAASATGTGSVQVVDPATLPLGPTSGKSKELAGILGGLLAGALISFLGTVALTRDKSGPWQDGLKQGQAPSHLGSTSVGLAVDSDGTDPRLANGRSRLSQEANGSAPSLVGAQEPDPWGVGLS
jgi:uncharacterized protein involved in exopolysaccharide biosynthesis